MGLLDDAIRDHLELKKRHGASKEEVSRLEGEVFGQGPMPPAPPPEPEAHEPEQPAFEPESPAFEAAPEPPAFEAAPQPPEPEAAAPEPAPEREPDFVRAPEPEPPAPEPAREPEPPAPPPRVEQPSDATVEYDVEAAMREQDRLEAAPPQPAPPREPASWLDDEEDEPDEVPVEESLEHRAPPTPSSKGPSEDVLEETPEFLQETPEHDRLWFEQKPPRDFDFDD